jgi:hypothetical protein
VVLLSVIPFFSDFGLFFLLKGVVLADTVPDVISFEIDAADIAEDDDGIVADVTSCKINPEEDDDDDDDDDSKQLSLHSSILASLSNIPTV